jgi:hypothetical protein
MYRNRVVFPLLIPTGSRGRDEDLVNFTRRSYMLWDGLVLWQMRWIKSRISLQKYSSSTSQLIQAMGSLNLQIYTKTIKTLWWAQCHLKWKTITWPLPKRCFTINVKKTFNGTVHPSCSISTYFWVPSIIISITLRTVTGSMSQQKLCSFLWALCPFLSPRLTCCFGWYLPGHMLCHLAYLA